MDLKGRNPVVTVIFLRFAGHFAVETFVVEAFECMRLVNPIKRAENKNIVMF